MRDRGENYIIHNHMTKKTFLLATAFLAFSSSPTLAVDKLENALSPADTIAVDNLVAPIFSNLKAGNYAATVNEFLGLSSMFDGKKQEMQYLISQIESTSTIYGRVSNCSLATVKTRAGIAQSRMYLCQHENFVTRWIVVVAKTSKGWAPVSLRFDDQMMLDD